MTQGFTFAGITPRVIFGSGALAQVGDEVARLGHPGAFIVSTP